MAYPTINGPYGLVPVNLMGGIPFAGSTRMIPIAQNYATSMFNGDVIGLSGGNAVITPYNANSSSAAAAGNIVGVFLGTQYPGTSPIFGNLQAQYYAANNNQSGMIAYVMDNPTALFKACVLAQAQGTANTQANTSTTVGYMSPRFVGTNAFLVAGNSGSTTTGNSAMGISGGNPTVTSSVAGNIVQTVGTGSGTAPCLRVVQLVQETAVTVATTLSSSPSNATTFTVASTTGIQPGMAVTIGGTVYSGSSTAPFPTLSTLVVTGVVTSTSTITVSSAVTATSGASVSFVGFPEVIVGWNFGYHSYLLAAGV
jgi:hypothetical protein